MLLRVVDATSVSQQDKRAQPLNIVCLGYYSKVFCRLEMLCNVVLRKSFCYRIKRKFPVLEEFELPSVYL